MDVKNNINFSKKMNGNLLTITYLQNSLILVKLKEKKMNLIKLILLCILAGVFVFIFAACGNWKTASQDGGPVTIAAANWDLENMPYILPMIEAFKQTWPDISVEIMDIPSADYTQKLMVMLNGGSDVDVFWIKDGDTIKSLVNKGQLADLIPYLIRDNIDLKVYNGLVDRFNIDNRIIALPARTDYYILYYNKDIFDAAKVPYPSNDMTWGEWEQLAARLTSGTGNNKIYGAHLHTWQACVQNWGVQDGKHTIMDTDYSFFKPYYDMAIRMQNAGTLWDYGSLRTGGIHYSSAFLQGKTATMPQGTWFLSTILNRIKSGEAKLRWGIAAIPHPAGTSAGWTVGSATPIAINEASRKKDAAWEFVKLVTGDEGARLYAEYGSFPSRANTQTLAEIAKISGMPDGSLEALSVKNISLDRPYEDYVTEVNQMLGEEHSLIMLKEVTVDQGLARMAKRSKEIQSK
jgi:multiple sugar transport system substrate-binding protein